MLRQYKRPNAEAAPGADASAKGPSYSPAFLKRQAVVSKVPEVAPGTCIDYDRGVLAKFGPGQVLPLRNSDFSRLERGPIRNYYVRDWYWRSVWGNTMNDTTFPNAHVPVAFLPGVDGTIEGLPGGTAMVPRSRLTFVLSTPAWTIDPASKDAMSNA